MRRSITVRCLTSTLIATATACADPCVDDGLLQDPGQSDACPAVTAADGSGEGSSSLGETDSVSNTAPQTDSNNSNSATDTDSTTDPDTTSNTDDASNTATDSTSDTDSTTASTSDTDDTTETASTTEGDTCNDGMLGGDETDVDCGGSCGSTCEIGDDCLVDEDCVSQSCGDDDTCQPNPLWCTDLDGDGFGDPGDCVMVHPDDPPPDGTVENGDDCDDGNGFAFPGAAPNDDALACMEDKDGDDWGDDDPSAAATTIGTDCDDDGPDAAATFPGAAPNEGDACMKDGDGDGWGDDTPDDGGVTPGQDCDEDGQAPCVLLVTQDGTTNDSYDLGLVGVLDDLGFVVTLVSDTNAVLDDANGFTLVVISETAQSTDIAGAYTDAIVPTICLEGLVWDDMGMAPQGAVTGFDSVTIVAVADPLAGGLVGNVDVISGNGSGTFTTTPPVGATLVASAIVNPNAIVEFAFDSGAAMQGGFIAPRRRIGLGLDADQGAGGATILADGVVLFEAAVLWAIE